MLCIPDTSGNAFISKVRLCCIVASCIGLFGLGDLDGLAAEPGLEPPKKSRLEHAHIAEDKPQDNLVSSDEELDSEDVVVFDDPGFASQVLPVTKPMNMRSIVSCGLLLLAMLHNIRAMVESSLRPVDEKNYQKKIDRGSFGSAIQLVVAYLCTYKFLEARGSRMSTTAWYPFISVSAEGFGILSLRTKIRSSGHAQGISAKSVALFAILYFDTAFDCPTMNARQLDIWACKVLEWVSLLLVVDVLYSILVTHRETYQKDLDVVPVKTMVCVCALFAFMYQPARVNDKLSSIGFTFRMYVDTFAFVPQVVMMSLQDRPVHAPVAHFVAVNAMGRMFDLAYWLDEYKFWSGPLTMRVSGWYVCLLHVASLIVVADFFYYYLKTWIAGRGFMEDVPIPSAMDV